MPNRHSKKQAEISLKPVEAETTRPNSALRFRESSSSDLKAIEIRPSKIKKPKIDSTHLATGTFRGQNDFVSKTEAHVQWYNGDQKEEEVPLGNKDFAPTLEERVNPKTVSMEIPTDLILLLRNSISSLS